MHRQDGLFILGLAKLLKTPFDQWTIPEEIKDIKQFELGFEHRA